MTEPARRIPPKDLHDDAPLEPVDPSYPPCADPATSIGTEENNACLNESSISRLLQRISRQDVHAVRELFDGISSEVQFAFQSLTHENPAEPLIEDIFWEIWRTAARFNPDSDSAYRWVIGKVACRASGHFFTSGEVTQTSPEGIWHALGAARSSAAVHGILADLSPRQLRISAQCLFLGMSVQQVAEANGVDSALVMDTLDIVKMRISPGAPHQPE